MTRLHLDFETRCRLELDDFGLDRYSREASILMLGWAFDDGPVSVEEDYYTPPIVHEALLDPHVQKVAWNASFERTIFRVCLGIDIPIPQWLDPSLCARYAALGGGLELASEFLNLGDEAKDKAGKALINLFCKPVATGKRKGQFNDKTTHPEEWAQFVEYCRLDVVAERAVLHRLEGFFTLPAHERRMWEIDQQINERGMPIDRVFVDNAQRLVTIDRERTVAEMKALTGLENPNSNVQLLKWLKTQGYPYSSLGAAKVEMALEDAEEEMDTEAL